MKIYTVLAHITVGAYAEIAASSLEDAQDQAADLKFDDYTIMPRSVTNIEQIEIEFGGEHDPEN